MEKLYGKEALYGTREELSTLAWARIILRYPLLPKQSCIPRISSSSRNLCHIVSPCLIRFLQGDSDRPGSPVANPVRVLVLAAPHSEPQAYLWQENAVADSKGQSVPQQEKRHCRA